VREAFVALAREGLVRRDAHRGAVVFRPTVDEVSELYEIRLALEPLATEIATRELSDQDLAGLDKVVAQMRDAKAKRFLELNAEFHGRIYAAANRPRLIEIIDGVREPAAGYIGLNVDLYDPKYRDEVQTEHEAIVAALRSGAPKRAARAMREHLEHSARHVAGLIEKTRSPTASAG
jgi:DNA-binding GntR family transcriptional regulator